MNVTPILVLWLIICISGFVTSVLSVKKAHYTFDELVRDETITSSEIIESVKHYYLTQIALACGWAVFVMAGLVDVFSSANNIIAWMLVATVAIWALITISDYLFGRKQWRARTKTKYPDSR